MVDNKFKYSKKFKKFLSKIDDDYSKKIISKEDITSVNIADITNSKNMVRLTIGRHEQKVKFGKFAKKVIPTINNEGLETLVNKFKSLQFKSLFKEVRGSEIPYFYHSKNYSKDFEKNSSLYESCMNNMEASTFDIYINNDNFRLLVLTDEYDKVVGRAIIVSSVNSTDGYEGMEVMLNPYVTHQSLINKFKDYAEINNIFYIEDIHKLDLFTKVNTDGIKNYPYIDYFQKLINGYLCYGYIDDKQKICGIKIQGGYKLMQSTEGNYSTIRGSEYYKSTEDFNKNKVSYTFNTSKIKRCRLTGKNFLIKDLVKFKSIDSISNPEWILDYKRRCRNGYINKELLKLSKLNKFDGLEFKKDIHFYNFMYTLISKFEKNIKFHAYSGEGWYHFNSDFNPEYDLYSRHQVMVTIKPKSLEFNFKIDNKFYSFSFKLKPSGITLKVYNTIIIKEKRMNEVEMGDLIINESNPLSTLGKLNEKISTYINEIKRIDK